MSGDLVSASHVSETPIAILISEFGLSGLLACILVGVVRIVARKFGFIDPPNPNTRNPGGAALGGGVGAILAIIVLASLATDQSTHWIAAGGVVASASLLGLVDDIRRLQPLFKVVGQIACGLILVYYLQLNSIEALAVITILVLCSNAWNVVDVMDSLLPIIGVLCFAGTALVCYLYGGPASELAEIAALAAGAMAGFLIWNWHPAKVILGDAGSLAFGMLYGTFIAQSLQISLRLTAAILVTGAIPFLEVGFLIVERSRRGIPFYVTTPDHFALRMLHSGYRVLPILLRVMLVGLACVIAAVLLVVSDYNLLSVIGMSIALGGWFAWAYRFLCRLGVGRECIR